VTLLKLTPEVLKVVNANTSLPGCDFWSGRRIPPTGYAARASATSQHLSHYTVFQTVRLQSSHSVAKSNATFQAAQNKTLILKLERATVSRGRGAGTPAMHYGGLGFKSRPQDRRNLSWFSSDPLRKCRIVPKIRILFARFTGPLNSLFTSHPHSMSIITAIHCTIKLTTNYR
jgi:hypothetical protein